MKDVASDANGAEIAAGGRDYHSIRPVQGGTTSIQKTSQDCGADPGLFIGEK